LLATPHERANATTRKSAAMTAAERAAVVARKIARMTVALAGKSTITLVNGTNGVIPGRSNHTGNIMTFISL